MSGTNLSLKKKLFSIWRGYVRVQDYCEEKKVNPAGLDIFLQFMLYLLIRKYITTISPSTKQNQSIDIELIIKNTVIFVFFPQ